MRAMSRWALQMVMGSQWNCEKPWLNCQIVKSDGDQEREGLGGRQDGVCA